MEFKSYTEALQQLLNINYINKYSKNKLKEYCYKNNIEITIVPKTKEKRYCPCCGKEIIGKNSKRKKFCSLSCSAKYNNSKRIFSESTKAKIGKSLCKDDNYVYIPQNSFKICQCCGKEYISNYRKSKYCSKECTNEGLYRERIVKWKEHPEVFNTESLPPYIRRYMMAKYGNKCEKCGWGEINPKTGFIPLQIHHIDGDCTNNKEENLQVLCPNCHSLTESFGSLNKGNSKRYSLKAYKEKIKMKE